MKNKVILNRKSTWLKSWDYSQPHRYLITIWTSDHINYFGEIKNGKMWLNNLGIYAEESLKSNFGSLQKCWGRLLYNNAKPHPCNNYINPVGTCHGMSLQNNCDREFGKPVKGSISMIINHFKGAVTKWANLNGYKNFKWQRSFYNRMIRNEKELYQIRKYIEQNPLAWELEKCCRRI